MCYTEELIREICVEIPSFISGKRLAHTYAVERECADLAAIFSAHPRLFSEEDAFRLRIAALLHDITKEKTREEQLALCEAYRIPLSDYERISPKVLHAKTAPFAAAAYFNERYAQNVVDDGIRDAIYTHTTGAARMSLIGKLLYLADYIEPTRTFEDCITLRNRFYDALPSVREDAAALLAHLDNVLLLSFDMTIEDLVKNGACIDPNTVAARNAILFERRHT